MAGLWYKNAIIYELHIRSFKDSDDDGKGDFNGLISKLDYLEFLGIDCIWLLPIYPSPGKDDGYDVADYCAINSEYGEMKDFKKFVKEAEKKGIRVLVELVINHTSDAHLWFKEAKKGPDSPYHDYYVWSDTGLEYQDARIIFTDTEISNWAWCPEVKKYYWHRFFSHQPDLNFRNPAVRKEIKQIIKFWFNTGVAGLRVDAAPYLFEKEGTNCENLPETHAFIKELREMMDRDYKGKVLLAEANQWPEDVKEYFGKGDEFHLAYNFPLMPRMFMAIQQEHHGPIVDIIKRTPKIPSNCQWVTFLRNHDELTLEMCTDQERDYMYEYYARDKQMKLNIGIRRRLAPLMENDKRKIELLYVMLFGLPGTPALYYGDEIGMGDNIYLGDRNGVRTPMQWDENQNAGFSSCQPSRLHIPIITDPEYNYHAVNVKSQSNNPNSLLNFIRRLIKISKDHPVFAEGSLDFIYPENKKILVFIRKKRNEKVLCVFNLSHTAQPVEIQMKAFSGYQPVEMLGNTPFPKIVDLPYILTLAPYGYYIFSLNKIE